MIRNDGRPARAPRLPSPELPTDREGRVLSAAQAALLALLQEHTRTELARLTGVDRTTIGKLASGAMTTDSYSLRRQIERVTAGLGRRIPMSDWDAPPRRQNGTTVPPQSTTLSSEVL